MLSKQQQQQLNLLEDYKLDIQVALDCMSRVLKTNFPNEYELAYQQWIPQIATAIRNYDKWLPRGSLTIEQTLCRIKDMDEPKGSGLTKVIGD